MTCGKFNAIENSVLVGNAQSGISEQTKSNFNRLEPQKKLLHPIRAEKLLKSRCTQRYDY
tara:strand:- start:433 stop:612 length:180 start_codon:yes stop_codon:yes gene_type:complete